MPKELAVKLLKPSELKSEFGIPLSTAAKWRMRGDGPAYIKIGRSVRYEANAVRDWLQSQAVMSTAAAFARDARS